MMAQHHFLIAALCLAAITSVAQEPLATLNGKVIDSTRSPVGRTKVELKGASQSQSFQAVADSNGEYRFSGLPAGEYTMTLLTPGFIRLTIKSIEITSAEQKSMPVLQLEIPVGECTGHAILDHIRFIKSTGRTSSLVGSVRVEAQPYQEDSLPIAGATVTLACSKCSKTVTDSNGAFAFSEMVPGTYSIRVEKPGYYSLTEPEYEIREGSESVYYPIHLERCPRGNCDPRLRPQKPVGLCE